MQPGRPTEPTSFASWKFTRQGAAVSVMPYPLDEGDAIESVEEVREIGIERGAAAGEPLHVGAQGGTDRRAHGLHVELCWMRAPRE